MSPNFAKRNTVIRYPPPITIRGNHSLIFLFISFTTIIFNKLCYSAPAVEIKNKIFRLSTSFNHASAPKKRSLGEIGTALVLFFSQTSHQLILIAAVH